MAEDRRLCPVCKVAGADVIGEQSIPGRVEQQSGPSGLRVDDDDQPHDHTPVWFERRYKCSNGHAYRLFDFRPCFPPCAWVPNGYPGPGPVVILPRS